MRLSKKKANLQWTSLAAYDLISKELTERQLLIYNCLRNNGPSSNRDLSVSLRKPINTITGRVKELREKGLVVQVNTKVDPITNVTVFVWGLPIKETNNA